MYGHLKFHFFYLVFNFLYQYSILLFRHKLVECYGTVVTAKLLLCLEGPTGNPKPSNLQQYKYFGYFVYFATTVM